MSEQFIPIIDFSACGLDNEDCPRDDLAAAGKLLVDAFYSVGFAYLSNTGISDSYVRHVHEVTSKLFTSPEEKKARYAMKGLTNFGWIGMKKENLSGDSNIPPDYKEVFNAEGSSSTRRNEEWPDDIAPGFSHAMKDFMERVKKLTFRVFHALAIGLDLEDEYFFYKCHSKMHTPGNRSTGRIVYYPPLKSELLPGQQRCGEHTDQTSITFVFQDEIGGLQVKDLDGKYIDVTPVKETVVVNVGDALQFWTNHQLKSTQHRVVVKESEVKNTSLRRSLIYFVVPNNGVIINKPLVYNDESKNKAVEPQEPLIYEQWLRRKIATYWKRLAMHSRL